MDRFTWFELNCIDLLGLKLLSNGTHHGLSMENTLEVIFPIIMIVNTTLDI